MRPACSALQHMTGGKSDELVTRSVLESAAYEICTDPWESVLHSVRDIRENERTKSIGPKTGWKEADDWNER